MLNNIFHNEGLPAERPLHLAAKKREKPANLITRNIRRDPPLEPGDEIYDRARIIFSRARRTAGVRASSIF
jgi:hypothetical protein